METDTLEVPAVLLVDITGPSPVARLDVMLTTLGRVVVVTMDVVATGEDCEPLRPAPPMETLDVSVLLLPPVAVVMFVAVAVSIALEASDGLLVVVLRVGSSLVVVLRLGASLAVSVLSDADCRLGVGATTIVDSMVVVDVTPESTEAVLEVAETTAVETTVVVALRFAIEGNTKDVDVGAATELEAVIVEQRSLFGEQSPACATFTNTGIEFGAPHSSVASPSHPKLFRL